MNIDITKTPSNNTDYYSWADYIEIACFINIDGIQTAEDVIDKVAQSRDLYSDNQEDDDPSPKFKSPAMRARWEQNAIDYFSNMAYRSEAFGDYYPFTVEGEEIQLIEPLTEKHHLYLFLLVSFNLRYFSGSERQKITSSFEVLSFKAFKNLFNDKTDVHIFGTAAGEIARYTGTPYQKAQTLIEDLREDFLPKVGEDDFPIAGGDLGLDLLAFMKFSDENDGLMIAFGQCACSQEDWVEKQASSSYDTWRHRITFRSPPTNFMFIPGCFRKVDGTWASNIKVTSILVDRLRLVHLLTDTPDALADLPAKELFDDVLTFKEEAV